jgi:hypothetical protein
MSRDCSTLPNFCAKDIRVQAVIIAELKLGDIERQVLFADLVDGPDHAALDQRPEPLDRVRVDGADDILPLRMIDDGARGFVACAAPSSGRRSRLRSPASGRRGAALESPTHCAVDLMKAKTSTAERPPGGEARLRRRADDALALAPLPARPQYTRAFGSM